MTVLQQLLYSAFTYLYTIFTKILHLFSILHERIWTYIEKQVLVLRAIGTNDKTLKIRAKVNDYTLSKTLKDKYNRPFKEICPKTTWENAINDDVKIFINHKDYYNVGKSQNMVVMDEGVFLEVELDPQK